MKNLNLILTALLVCLLASCESSDSVSPEAVVTDPFSNGGSERNMTVVMSDIHLGADTSYAECKKNLKSLTKLLQQIRVSPNINELVIAGDLLDEWFVPATTNTYGIGKSQSDFIDRIAISNKTVVDLFNQIIQEGKITVTYVPGNHDLNITAANVNRIFPGINQARDTGKPGVGTYHSADQKIAVEHGHRYNFFCAPDPYSNQTIAPGTIMPAGYFFTRIATLHIVQDCHIAGDTLAVVTPNTNPDLSQSLLYNYWYVWQSLLKILPIENNFDDKMIVTEIAGFTENYSVNDLLPYQSTPGGMIDLNLYKGSQDKWNERQIYNNVAVPFTAERAIKKANSATETDSLSLTQYFMNPNSSARIVVFGHNHEPKIRAFKNYNDQKTIYANSGTWIDENPNKTTMNFVVITPQNINATSQTHVKLYNFLKEVVTKMAEDSLRY